MAYLLPLIAVILLFLAAYAGVEQAGLDVVFGVLVPYLAAMTFVVGIIYRLRGWVRSAVPFRIPTTCGQQKSLPWIKQNKVDNPSSTGGVLLRMILEIVTFRSLFRNTQYVLRAEGKPFFRLELFLWVAALAFHYSFLVVIIRHLRFFLEPAPFFLPLLESLDGFIQLGLPGVMVSGIVLLAAVFYLFLRRLYLSQVRYISLAADYLPLFLIMGIAITGILMRYFIKADVVAIKELTMGLVTLRPTIPDGISAIFYVHLLFVCVLVAYFPFSKLMHMGGIFLSPTRNLANNNRMVRHVNPWNYPVKVHTYEEYEDEFRDKMIEAGIPVEKE